MILDTFVHWIAKPVWASSMLVMLVWVIADGGWVANVAAVVLIPLAWLVYGWMGESVVRLSNTLSKLEEQLKE